LRNSGLLAFNVVLGRNSGVKVLRIGVFGGTFNPIHLGHLHIARKIQALFSLSQVHFVVATMPPHKRPEDLIPFTHRFAMVSLATAASPSFMPSMIELMPQASPYSIDTMEKLSRHMEQEKGILYFIAGGDSLLDVNSWRESERLLNSFNFIFVKRPGTKPLAPEGLLSRRVAARVRDFSGLKQTQLKRRITKENENPGRIFIVDIGAPDISATKIREWVSEGKSVRKMVPGPVYDYIRKLHLYGGR
jgi:nicotinate-nucleotide adenylyltransferase